MKGYEGQIRGAVDRLVERGVLSADQAEPVVTAVGEALRAVPGQETAGPAGGGPGGTPAGRTARWAEILSYAGGTLVLAGGSVLVATSWEDMSRAGRVGLLTSVTLALLGIALWAGWGSRALLAFTGSTPPTTGPVRQRVAAVTWTLGAGTAALAAGEIQDSHDLLIATAVGLAVALAGYLRVPGALGLIAVALFSLPALHEVLGLRAEPPTLLVAMATIALAGVYAALAAARAIPHRALGLGIGAAVALIGAQWPVAEHPAWAYVLTFLVALGCLGLYTLVRTWVLIVAGVLGITIAVPEAIWDLTDGGVGGALITVITGFALLGAGGLGLAWHRHGGGDD